MDGTNRVFYRNPAQIGNRSNNQVLGMAMHESIHNIGFADAILGKGQPYARDSTKLTNDIMANCFGEGSSGTGGRTR
jgi:hypothetical protein